eukprot:9413583-Alexandrium_andersonii.AAC.1
MLDERASEVAGAIQPRRAHGMPPAVLLTPLLLLRRRCALGNPALRWVALRRFAMWGIAPQKRSSSAATCGRDPVADGLLGKDAEIIWPV